MVILLFILKFVLFGCGLYCGSRGWHWFNNAKTFKELAKYIGWVMLFSFVMSLWSAL